MGDLADYFNRDEFACSCGCGGNTVDAGLLNILVKVRDYFGRRMTITSGYRCDSRNRVIGGAPSSWHLKGRAADVKVEGISPQLVAEIAAQYGAKGIKTYETWTHIDTRNGTHWRE
jgi:uncharacterized protein YcbK (DUF882 family)